MRADEPDTAEGDDPEAAIGFVGEVCARATTVGGRQVGDAVLAVKIDGGAVQWWRYFPSLAAPLT